MINFVSYFSTAQDELGYVVLHGYGTIESKLMGGPELAQGVYRLEDGVLVQVQVNPVEAAQLRYGSERTASA
jgi:hypothetical protein